MNELLTPLVITGQVLAMILAADLLIALAHRLMDKFGEPSWRPKLLGRIFRNNREHHAWPQHLLRHGALKNATETLPIGLGILLAAWIVDMLTWQVMVFAAAVAWSAVFHRLLHLRPEEVCLPVRWLQRIGVLQSRSQHVDHHRWHDRNYAVLTNVANWLLERTQAFKIIDRFFSLCLKLKEVDLALWSHEARRQKKKR